MNKINIDIPEDFDWERYIDLNDDVKQCYPTKEGATHHYLTDGIKQKRIYRTKNIPDDFDWEIYLAINPDVYSSCKSKTSSIMHYENHGHIEKRFYKLSEVNIPVDFDWECYIINNPSLEITSKIVSIRHYYTIGRKNNLSYKFDLNTIQLPDNFNWKIYIKLNDLEKTCLNERAAIIHYLRLGSKQNYLYNFPKGSIPDDFDWIWYTELNTDVKQMFGTKELATYHYYITGKTEGRIYKLNHTPNDFDWETYIENNQTISNEYKKNEYTAKLHYDLFGYPQKLDYKNNFNNIPNDFDWEMYIKYNPDIKDICSNELKCKQHYNKFGIYQNRQYSYKKKQLTKDTKNNLYPFLFHKYILNITKKVYNIPYTISNEISKINTSTKKTLVAHLHCYNIEQFDKFYGEYINKIIAYCEYIVITYSIGNITNKINNIIYLKCLNQGMDIGGKFVCINYLKKNNVNYNYILFLHSKSDNYMRKLYWEPILNNLHNIKKTFKNNNQYGIFVPPLIYMGDYAAIIYKDKFVNIHNVTCKWNFGNSLYINDIDRYFKYNSNNFIFPEGNCFICNSQIANELYGNTLLYNLLNNKYTMDIVWIKSLYGSRGFNTGNTIDDIYTFFKNENTIKLYPNNISWGAGHAGHADNMYEHSFERIVFKVVEKLKYKVKILPYNKNTKYLQELQDMNDKINKLFNV